MRSSSRNKELLHIPCDNGRPNKICFTRRMHGVTEEMEIPIPHPADRDFLVLSPLLLQQKKSLGCPAVLACSAAHLICERPLQGKNVNVMGSKLMETTLMEATVA